MSSVAGSKTCVITAGIKKYKTITMKKRKKHNKRVLLAKEILSYKLAIEVSIYKGFFNPCICHIELFFQWIMLWENIMIIWKKQ